MLGSTATSTTDHHHAIVTINACKFIPPENNSQPYSQPAVRHPSPGETAFVEWGDGLDWNGMDW